MPDRWNDPRDDRYRREARYRREPYDSRFRRADESNLDDYVTTPREGRSFGAGHEHDADWDADYSRAADYDRGYDLDPYYPGGIADSRPYDRERDRSRYATSAPRGGGYDRQPPFGGVRASGGGPVYGRADFETRVQRSGPYGDFRVGRPASLDRDYDDRRPDEGRNFLDRAADRVASWFGGHEADPRSGGSRHSHRGRGPRGYRRSDQRISDDINDALTDDHYLDASEITVAVASCEVTLTGVVADREAKHRAERIAERVSGVDHVQNNLRIGHVEGSKPFAGGNPLTSPGRGFGDSVLEAQAKGETPKTVDEDRKN